MATHSSILAWRIPWTEEPGGLQSTGSQSWTHTHTEAQQILEAILDSKVLEDDCKELMVVNSCDEPIECGTCRSVPAFFSSSTLKEWFGDNL